MQLCKSCGMELPDDSRFCGRCGQSIDNTLDLTLPGAMASEGHAPVANVPAVHGTPQVGGVPMVHGTPIASDQAFSAGSAASSHTVSQGAAAAGHSVSQGAAAAAGQAVSQGAAAGHSVSQGAAAAAGQAVSQGALGSGQAISQGAVGPGGAISQGAAGPSIPPGKPPGLFTGHGGSTSLPVHGDPSSLPTHPLHPPTHHTPSSPSSPQRTGGCASRWLMISLAAIIIIAGIISGLTLLSSPTISLSGSHDVSVGETLHLHGGGFFPGGSVTFTLDGHLPLLFVDRNLPVGMGYLSGGFVVDRSGSAAVLQALVAGQAGQSNSLSNAVKVGVSGSFDVAIVVSPDWSVGSHTVRATESFIAAGLRSAALTFNILASPAKLTVFPLSLDFGKLHKGGKATQVVTISDEDQQPLNWTADAGTANWLALDMSSGTLQPGASQAIQVTADTTSLSPGSYPATLGIRAGSEDVQVAVTLVVTALPTPTPSPTPTPFSPVVTPTPTPSPTPTPTPTPPPPPKLSVSPRSFNIPNDPNCSFNRVANLWSCVATLTNKGNVNLKWSASSSGASVSPSHGVLSPGHLLRVIITVPGFNCISTTVTFSGPANKVTVVVNCSPPIG